MDKKSKMAMILAIAAMSAFGENAMAEKWSFGVMADTQWSGTDPTGNNINTVAVNQIKACNFQFINAGVDFVVQVGDLCDSNNSANGGLQTRLDANAELSAAGIEFYGLRGNHESGSGSKTFFNANYIPASTLDRPVVVNAADTSSYTVTVNNVKIALIDYDSASGTTSKLDSMTTWLDGELEKADHDHAFVFQHKNLLGQNHKDNMFGGTNDANTTQQNNFLKVLDDNGVRFDISGHDHMHHQSLVTSPDGQSTVHELICASDSYKYYTPSTPYSSRETPIAQELYKTGYYIFTVEGPKVNVDYYATTPLANGDIPANPVWTLDESFGYSLNGKEFMVASGDDFGMVQDAFDGTSMHLSGVNSSVAKTYDGRLVYKDINTGWTVSDDYLSDVLTLWGLEDVNAPTVAGGSVNLTLSYDTAEYNGVAYIAKQNMDMTWTPLASVINGDGTVTAVISGDGNYAVVPEPASISLIGIGALGLLARRRRA